MMTKYPYQNFAEMKQRLFKKRGHVCAWCQAKVGDKQTIMRFWKRTTIVLQPEDFLIHHKDFNKHNLSEENLVIVCGHCHSKYHRSHRINPKLDKFLARD